MASFLDALGAASAPLVAAQTGNLQGQNIGNEQNTSNLMDVVKLYQQKAAQDLARQKAQSEMGLQDAQTKELNAKTTAANIAAGQEGYLHGTDFQNDYQQAMGGDKAAVSRIAGRVAGHPSAGAILGTITPKDAPETWTLSPEFVTTTGGAVKVSNKGNITDTEGKPLTAAQIKHYNPPASNVYTTGTGADGKPEIFAGTSKGTPSLTPMGVGKPSGTGGMGGSLDADSRAKMMAQAKIDNDEMKRIEKRVQSGDLTFGTGAGLATAAANAHGGAVNEAVSVLGNAAAGAMDPDIQKYLTANSSYGRIMGNLQSKRYTDNQAQIEKTISGLKGNDLNNTISYKQQLRDASLNDEIAKSTQTGAGGRSQGAGGGNVGTATQAQQLWDAAVAKHGRDKVLSEYGPRP